MSHVSERIGGLIKSSGMSTRELAKRIGVSSVSLSQWSTGKYKPSEEGLEALCNYFNVTPAFILYGDGNAPEGQSIRISADTYSIPLLDVKGSCGLGDYVEGALVLIRMIRVTALFLRTYCSGASPRSLQMIQCNGDSMEPTLKNGETVFVDTSQTSADSDGIYAVSFDGRIFIKRIQLVPNGLRLLSDNRFYDPIQIPNGEHLKIVGRCYSSLAVKTLL